MRGVQILLLAMLAFLVSSNATYANDTIDPIAAIIAVEANEGKAIAPVTIIMNVLNTGEDRKRVFLNSEKDYRVRTSLNIAILPKARRKFTKAYAQDPMFFFMDKCIRVTGSPRKVRIRVKKADGTQSYYYQTHLPVKSIKQIELCDAFIS